MTYEEAVEYSRSLTEDQRRDIDRLLGPLRKYSVEDVSVVRDPDRHDDYEAGTQCVCGGHLFDGVCLWCAEARGE